MNPLSILFIATIALNLNPTCNAYPWGAGTCGTGEAISTANNSNSPHGSSSSGSIDDGGLKLSVTSDAITTDKLNAEETTTLNLDTTHKFQLMGDNSSIKFKGFMIRLQGKSEQDISTTLSNPSTTLAQSSIAKCSDTAEAITHSSSVEKSQIPFELDFIKDGDYTLEVTVVISKLNWHYSKFNIQVLSAALPSSSPTLSSAPSLVPISEPTSEPSVQPTSAPTSEPSVQPSSAPSLSSAPTQITESPTSAPSSSPVTSPSSDATRRVNCWNNIAITLIAVGLNYAFW